MSNPKRPCGHTKITDCPVCTDTLLLALRWAVAHPKLSGDTVYPLSTRSVMQAAVDRYEAAQ
jgi:hypothetical protein